MDSTMEYLWLGFEYYQKKSKFYKKNKNETWYKVISWFITINLVIIGLYIFSGEPYKLISHVFLMNRQMSHCLLNLLNSDSLVLRILFYIVILILVCRLLLQLILSTPSSAFFLSFHS